jgi:hypothetical protein
MQSLRGRRRSARHAAPTQYITRSLSIAVVDEGPEQAECRYEPETFGAVVPTDPYTAWLAQREAEREREAQGSVRWVVRPRAVAGSAAR